MHLPKIYIWLIAGVTFTTLSMSAYAAKGGGGKPPPQPASTTLDTLGCTGDGEVARYSESVGGWECSIAVGPAGSDGAEGPTGPEGPIGPAGSVDVLDPTFAELFARIALLEKCGSNRYADQGDGTVLDCNTGLVWLKDASCLTGSWGLNTTVGTVQKKVEELNTGTNYDCTDYVTGKYTNWRLPTIAEFCSRGALDGYCLPADASDSLIDSSLLDVNDNKPLVRNTTGTGRWSEGDPFVGVEFYHYWSGTERNSTSAWITHPNTAQVTSGIKTHDFLSAWPVRDEQ